ncbi:MAG TPA: PEP-CTERM sorting domain-containing protein [Aquabacterium sp.]|nr:PEP-CTERM sorting domain-containing protein [Aquabacterium sp.]
MDRKFFKATALTLGALVMVGSASAANVTLNTAGKKATATLVLSADAKTKAAAAGLSFGADGNAYTGSTAGTFVLPITKSVVDVRLFRPITPVSGEAIGSALLASKGTKTLALANFKIDYAKDEIAGDFIYNGQTQNMSLFSFTESTPRTIKLSGLSLVMNQTLGDVRLTSGATSSLTSALGSSGALSAFAGANMGTITIDVSTLSRKAVSTKPYTASMMVPEASTYAMMALGLAGIGFVARRKARA